MMIGGGAILEVTVSGSRRERRHSGEAITNPDALLHCKRAFLEYLKNPLDGVIRQAHGEAVGARHRRPSTGDDT
jgi:hypothetical protein